jgi:hypothetical protein
MNDKLQGIEMNVELADKFHGKISSDSWLMDAINRNDVLWLIGQVKTLREELEIERNHYNHEAKRNKFQLDDRIKLKEQLARYKNALEEIAEQPSFIPSTVHWDLFQTVNDMGKIARKVLEVKK